jgi:hypothetical protein
MQRLQDVAAKQLATVDQQAARVDAERLAAIGLRQRAAALAEVCVRVLCHSARAQYIPR